MAAGKNILISGLKVKVNALCGVSGALRGEVGSSGSRRAQEELKKHEDELTEVGTQCEDLNFSY